MDSLSKLSSKHGNELDSNLAFQTRHLLDFGFRNMVKVRQVEKKDLPRYKELTDVEKWNHTLAEYELCLERSPTGAFCVELDDGKLVSFCSGYNLDENNILVYRYLIKTVEKLDKVHFSYITEKKYRGMGYGSMAFKAVVEWSKGKNLYLNSADGKGRK